MATASSYDRSEILKPYLERLAALGQHASEPTKPSRVTIGTQSFEIEPWERDAVLRTVEANGSTSSGWEALLAESVALRAKTLSLLEKLADCDATDPQAVDTVYAHLQLDAALGFALLAELQRAVDGLVATNEMGPAKRLTRFRNKLSREGLP